MTETERPPRKRLPTQADVARLAGVSQPLVSYVLNNKLSITVPEETRLRVLRAVEELGYVPDRSARSLRTRRTLTIASIISDITNPFYPAFQRGIQDVAEAGGYDLIAYNTDGQAAIERKALKSALQHRVDGVIITPFQLAPDDFTPLLMREMPVVALAQPEDFPPLPGFDRLYVDNDAAAYAAVTHLLDQGHQHIAMITGGAPPSRGRERGFRRALAERLGAGHEAVICPGDFSEESGYAATLGLLRRQPPPTGIFAANDLMALGALAALREQGRRVPEDVAVVGFDDIPATRLVTPPLTTVAQFPKQLGRRAAEMLLERLAGSLPPEGRLVEMPFALVPRASSAREVSEGNASTVGNPR